MDDQMMRQDGKLNSTKLDKGQSKKNKVSGKGLVKSAIKPLRSN